MSSVNLVILSNLTDRKNYYYQIKKIKNMKHKKN